MDLYIRPDEWEMGSVWPPNRYRRRARRLKLYEELMRGDVTYFVEDSSAVAVTSNMFYRYSQRVGSLMTMTLPEDVASRPVLDSVHAILSSGRAVSVTDGEDYWCPRPGWCYETTEGGMLVAEPARSDQDDNDGYPDRLLMFHVEPSGRWEAWETELTTGRQAYPLGDTNTVGALIEGSERSGMGGMWSDADNAPSFGRWGRSAYDDLVPLVTQIALRWTGAGDVFAHNERPMTIMPMALDDFADAVREDDYEPGDTDVWGRRNIQEKVAQARLFDTLGTPNLIEKVDVVEWSGNLGHALPFTEQLLGEARAIMGIPSSVLESGLGSVSGRALNTLLFMLYLDTRETQTALSQMWGDLLGMEAGWWPNALEAPLAGDVMMNVDEIGEDPNMDMRDELGDMDDSVGEQVDGLI